MNCEFWRIIMKLSWLNRIYARSFLISLSRSLCCWCVRALVIRRYMQECQPVSQVLLIVFPMREREKHEFCQPCDDFFFSLEELLIRFARSVQWWFIMLELSSDSCVKSCLDVCMTRQERWYQHNCELSTTRQLARSLPWTVLCADSDQFISGVRLFLKFISHREQLTAELCARQARLVDRS